MGMYVEPNYDYFSNKGLLKAILNHFCKYYFNLNKFILINTYFFKDIDLMKYEEQNTHLIQSCFPHIFIRKELVFQAKNIHGKSIEANASVK